MIESPLFQGKHWGYEEGAKLTEVSRDTICDIWKTIEQNDTWSDKHVLAEVSTCDMINVSIIDKITGNE